MIRVGDITVRFVWVDSFGAKSFSFVIECEKHRILVDAGAAEMQPSYPLPKEEKRRLLLKALEAIERGQEGCEAVVITHYHYDHVLHEASYPQLLLKVVKGRLVLAKDPNKMINKSQWFRARRLFEFIAKSLGADPQGIYTSPGNVEHLNPVSNIPEAASRAGKEVVENAMKWFESLKRLWSRGKWVREFSVGDTKLVFADGKTFSFGNLRVRFTEPLYHGKEFEKTGWVIAAVFEAGDAKVLYTSDLQGPVIEDYASWVIEEDPDVMIADGPPTYLLGYMMSRSELERAVKNMVRILKETSRLKLVVYDHHLLRDIRYRERVAEIYKKAKETGKEVITAAEAHGMKPLADELRERIGKK